MGVEGKVPALVPLAGEMPPVDYPLPLDIPVTVDGELIGGSGTLRAIEAEVLLDHGEERADENTRILALTGEVHITESGAGGTAYINEDDLGVSVDGIRVEQLDAETPPPTADLPGGSAASATWVFVIPADGKAGILHFGSDSADDAKGGVHPPPSCPDAARVLRGPGSSAVDPGPGAPGRGRPIVGQVPPRAHGGEPGGGRDAAQVVRGAAAGWSCARPVGVCGETGSWS